LIAFPSQTAVNEPLRSGSTRRPKLLRRRSRGSEQPAVGVSQRIRKRGIFPVGQRSRGAGVARPVRAEGRVRVAGVVDLHVVSEQDPVLGVSHRTEDPEGDQRLSSHSWRGTGASTSPHGRKKAPLRGVSSMRHPRGDAVTVTATREMPSSGTRTPRGTTPPRPRLTGIWSGTSCRTSTASVPSVHSRG
jgi:hypothetical protein